MAAASESCCTRCSTFIITIGLTALFLWLSLRVDEPKCYIDYIYVPALNKTLNSPKNHTLSFTLKLVNPNKDKGIKYDAINVSFKIFVALNATRSLGNATVDHFYQGHQKKALKPGSLLASGNFTAPVDGKVFYRVDFETAVKYKILLWYTKRDHLWGGANVEIADSGLKVYSKPVRLGNSPPLIESGAPEGVGRYRALLPFFFAVLILFDAHWLT
ncbi:protein NDR1-like [Abrus precatorius]|uniref:Protein NDR1-like n=1 Tax=Abrus precatorius TaxID=3816 RepID=A0A8B8KJD4_ABRPR|nr:protein NDR1-like [Abrus precatorius]